MQEQVVCREIKRLIGQSHSFVIKFFTGHQLKFSIDMTTSHNPHKYTKISFEEPHWEAE